MRNLDGFFKPKNLAIIGASRTPGSLGKMFLDAVVKYGYRGQIFPVNPKAEEIDGYKCYPSIDDLPARVDMAVILVRKDIANAALKQCGEKGIKNVIVISAGYKEVGGDGIEREKELMALAKQYDMNIIGPNCMGIINADPQYALNASFSPNEPKFGGVAFISQSGALGVAVLDIARRMKLGFSIFISEGNKADLNDTDFLSYLSEEPNTKVITMYMESIENGPEFMKTAGKVSRKKPVLVLKAGRTSAGQKAASSHTGALASSDAATQAMLDQSGVLRAESVQELFELALAFSTQEIPANDNIAVLTNSGGPAILAADALEVSDLKLASLNETTIQNLKEFLPEEAAFHNPVDMLAAATHHTYAKSAEILMNDPDVGALFVIIVRPPVDTTPQKIISAIHETVGAKPAKPVFFVVMTDWDEKSGIEEASQFGFPVYEYPESAARAIAAMRQYANWKSKPMGQINVFDVKKENTAQIIATAKNENREHLYDSEVRQILQNYGFPIPKFKVVKSIEEALEFKNSLKNPVVLKIESPKIIHKSDIGGVKINLNSDKEIMTAYHTIMENALKHASAHEIDGILVQEMVKGGKEVALGLVRDPNYGPMIMFGLGGIFIEIFKDVIFRIAPVTEVEAMEMIKSIKGFPILAGARGEQSVDLNILAQSIQKLSQLVVDFDDILEMDINPFMANALADLSLAVDARIRIQL